MGHGTWMQGGWGPCLLWVSRRDSYSEREKERGESTAAKKKVAHLTAITHLQESHPRDFLSNEKKRLPETRQL